MGVQRRKIHIVVTGGTIGSALTNTGTLTASGRSDTADFENTAFGSEGSGTTRLLIGSLSEETQSQTEFSFSAPYLILSENLNPEYWNALIRHLRAIDFSKYDALMITHGTDTLAYTANLLALLLFGIEIPVYLIASARPLDDPTANGYAHFKAAMISAAADSIPGVYVPYLNADGKLAIHKGEKLLQAVDFSADFRSVPDESFNDIEDILKKLRHFSDCTAIDPEPNKIKPSPLLFTIPPLSANILSIRPYPGIRYDVFDLTKTDAILHGTYHSDTAPYTIEGLAKKAAAFGIQCYIAPIDDSARRRYETTEKIIGEYGVLPIDHISFEMAYIFLLIAYSAINSTEQLV